MPNKKTNSSDKKSDPLEKKQAGSAKSPPGRKTEDHTQNGVTNKQSKNNKNSEKKTQQDGWVFEK